MSIVSRREFFRSAAAGAAVLAGGLPLVTLGEKTNETKTASKGPSKKKGLPIVPRDNNNWAKRLQMLNACWFYSWGARLVPTPPKGIEWMPQIFPHKGEDIAKSCASVKAAGYKTLLGYNEPDHTGQGNITVDEAVKHWPTLEATGMKLISPAVTWAPNKWMKDFWAQAQAKKFRIDAVAIHWYAGPDPDAFMKYVKGAYNDYGKPIWITEFAISDKKATKEKPCRFTTQNVMDFMKAVLPQFEALDWIEKYCWYNPHSTTNEKMGPSCLFDDKGELTELGKYYATV